MIKRARDQGVNAVTLAFIDDLEDMIKFAEEKKDRRTRIKLGKIENELFLLSSDLDYKNYEKRVVEDLIESDRKSENAEKEIREKIKEVRREKERKKREEKKREKKRKYEKMKEKENFDDCEIFLISDNEETLKFVNKQEAAEYFDVPLRKIHSIRRSVKIGGKGNYMGYYWFFEE